ncbi:Zn-dependent peptidase ImmA (M78 family) [Leifsonia sp. EB41]|uniref:ImmA/IrrE family metallo-endopeptidase n=1 Tax=Leifsonia sp. EB41 TaxID=3156260 RepID=UPI0035123A12
MELIDAAWPQWWSDDASNSTAASAELRFTLARRLGLSPTSLLEEDPVFVWHDTTRFKGFTASTAEEAALASFALSIGRLAAAGTAEHYRPLQSAKEIRTAILNQFPTVTLLSLLALSWGVGIPVLHLRVFPLDAKRMDAMSVIASQRPVILLARDSPYPAQLAFTLAHELGHIVLNHFDGQTAVVDFGDPVMHTVDDEDPDEAAANDFALELLTGNPDFVVEVDQENFNGAQLADAVQNASERFAIEPSTFALAVGHRTHRWEQVYSAINILGDRLENLPSVVNQIAFGQLNWENLGDENAYYLSRLLGEPSDA